MERAEAKRKKSEEETINFQQNLDDILASLSDTDGSDDDDDNSDYASDSDPEYIPEISFMFNGKIMSSRNMVSLRAIAIIADKYELSDRAVAALVTATLVDFGLVSQENVCFVVDRLKVRRAREKLREESRGERNENAKTVTAIIADGKSSKEYMAQKKVGGKTVKCKGSWIKNITLTTEPESQYFSHFILTEKPTKDRPAARIFCEEMLKEFRRCGGDVDNLQMFGSDSENTNTGHLGGVATYLEKSLDRKLLFCVCCLHLNELPYKASFRELDGSTKSATTYSGKIGKLLPKAEDLPFNPDFVPLDGPPVEKLSPEFVKSLTKDVLPQHIDIVKCPLLTEGSRHWFRLVQRIRLLAPVMKEIVRKNILRNSYYFHSELLLLCLLTSSELEEREFAVTMILKIRSKAGNEDEGDDGFRIRKYPREINFEAEKLQEIIPLKLYTSEPSYTCGMKKVDLLKVITDGLSVPPWPCHTRSVEQSVQKVHKAIQVVSSKEAAEGLILNHQLGCALVPKNESKKDLAGLSKARSMSYKDSIKKK